MTNRRHNFAAHTTKASLTESAAVRARFLRWIETTGTRRIEALARIGWHSSPPGWMSGGNIPEQWRLRIGRVMDGSVNNQGTKP